jgi:hypothetical protein
MLVNSAKLCMFDDVDDRNKFPSCLGGAPFLFGDSWSLLRNLFPLAMTCCTIYTGKFIPQKRKHAYTDIDWNFMYEMNSIVF